MSLLSQWDQAADIRFLKGRTVDPRRPEPIPSQVLRIGLFDEIRAFTFYSMVIERFGPRRPFVSIVEAERRHRDGLAQIAARHGVPVPPNPWRAELTVPKRFEDCCAAGVSAERDNAAMYEGFLAYPLPPDLWAACVARCHASHDNHLPAFLHCAGHEALEREHDARQAKAREPLWRGVVVGVAGVLVARAAVSAWRGRAERKAATAVGSDAEAPPSGE